MNEIKELRKRLHMTQKEFASALGLTNCITVSRWENGKCKPSRLWQEKIDELKNK